VALPGRISEQIGLPSRSSTMRRPSGAGRTVVLGVPVLAMVSRVALEVQRGRVEKHRSRPVSRVRRLTKSCSSIRSLVQRGARSGDRHLDDLAEPGHGRYRCCKASSSAPGIACRSFHFSGRGRCPRRTADAARQVDRPLEREAEGATACAAAITLSMPSPARALEDQLRPMIEVLVVTDSPRSWALRTARLRESASPSEKAIERPGRTQFVESPERVQDRLLDAAVATGSRQSAGRSLRPFLARTNMMELSYHHV